MYWHSKSISVLFFIVISSASMFWYCSRLKNIFIQEKKIIEESRKISGTIISRKKIDEKNYNYCIKTYAVYGRKKKSINVYISLRSRQKITIGSFCTFNYIHWFINENESSMLDISLSKGINAYGVCAAIYVWDNSFKQFPQYIIEKIQEKKESIVDAAQKSLDPISYYFFSAIALGNVDNSQLYYDALCKKWGIMHYLARSGLHIVLILQFIMALLVCVGLSYKRARIGSLVFLLFFYCLSFPSLPFQRALITSILQYVALSSNKNTTPLFLFCLCTLLFLLYNPFYVINLGFQLSFFITGILIAISRKYKNY
jgi:ComEC/Rec2-related protein